MPRVGGDSVVGPGTVRLQIAPSLGHVVVYRETDHADI